MRILKNNECYLPKSKPNWRDLNEYILYNGIEWCKSVFGLTEEQIESILYGGELPTEEKDKRLKEKIFACDEGKGRKRMLSMYWYDHFIWDKMTELHERCASNPEPDGVVLSDEQIDEITNLYLRLMSDDMKRSGNGLKHHGWQLGERVINQTTGKTSDDNISDMIVRMLITGNVYSVGASKKFSILEHLGGITDDLMIQVEEYEKSLETECALDDC